MHRKIVCLGDSLTYGFPYGPHVSWVAYASRICGLNLSNAGVNGNTMADMAARFDRDVLAKKPDAVVILGGSNDAFWGDVPCQMTVSFLEQMVASAVANKILPVIGIPMPIDDSMAGPVLDRLTTEYRHISSKLMLPTMDFRTPFLDAGTGRIRTDLYLDGVHPNLDGYRVMGETAVDFFRIPTDSMNISL